MDYARWSLSLIHELGLADMEMEVSKNKRQNRNEGDAGSGRSGVFELHVNRRRWSMGNSWSAVANGKEGLGRRQGGA